MNKNKNNKIYFTNLTAEGALDKVTNVLAASYRTAWLDD